MNDWKAPLYKLLASQGIEEHPGRQLSIDIHYLKERLSSPVQYLPEHLGVVCYRKLPKQKPKTDI